MPGSQRAELADIADRDDVERLVRAFYEKALVDAEIGYLFEIAQLDLEAHLPIMVGFWQTMLLGVRAYHRNAFAVHAELHAKEPLTAAHFDRWLALWAQTVDELFAGERAELAKAHATRVGRAFALRLSGRRPPLLTVRPLPEG